MTKLSKDFWYEIRHRRNCVIDDLVSLPEGNTERVNLSRVPVAEVALRSDYFPLCNM
jgi:hypothetical protein